MLGMSEIKWIKITTDIFDDEKMCLIDALPDRDAIIVIWIKLILIELIKFSNKFLDLRNLSINNLQKELTKYHSPVKS